METNNFSKEELKREILSKIKNDNIDENQLENLIGGNLSEASGCSSCNCWAGNSNDTEKAEISSAVN